MYGVGSAHSGFASNQQVSQLGAGRPQPSGPGGTYSVKYLGIVDGAMGILSRKMAMQGSQKNPASIAEVKKAKNMSGSDAIMVKTYGQLRPVLGGKWEQQIKQRKMMQNNNEQLQTHVIRGYAEESPQQQEELQINHMVSQGVGQSQNLNLHGSQGQQTSFQNVHSQNVIGSEDANRGTQISPLQAADTNNASHINVNMHDQINMQKVSQDIADQQIADDQQQMGSAQRNISQQQQHSNALRLSGQNIVGGNQTAQQSTKQVYSNQEYSGDPAAGNIMMNMALVSQMSDERISGYPQPQLYDQHYINKYAYPKGLKACRRSDKDQKTKRSLYDMSMPQNRKGFSGWKLTKRPQDVATQDYGSVLGLGLSGSAYNDMNSQGDQNQPRKKAKSLGKKKRYNSKAGNYRLNEMDMQQYQNENALSLGNVVNSHGQNNIVQQPLNQYNTNPQFVPQDDMIQSQGSQGNVPLMSYGATKLGESITNIEVGSKEGQQVQQI